MEPRELVAPFQISENTLHKMDQSIENYKAAKVSEAIITLSAMEKSIKKENEQKADKREDKKKGKKEKKK